MSTFWKQIHVSSNIFGWAAFARIRISSKPAAFAWRGRRTVLLLPCRMCPTISIVALMRLFPFRTTVAVLTASTAAGMCSAEVCGLRTFAWWLLTVSLLRAFHTASTNLRSDSSCSLSDKLKSRSPTMSLLRFICSRRGPYSQCFAREWSDVTNAAILSPGCWDLWLNLARS